MKSFSTEGERIRRRNRARPGSMRKAAALVKARAAVNPARSL